MARHAQRLRRRAGSHHPSCPTSTWTGWTSSSNNSCCRNTTSAAAVGPTRRIRPLEHAIARARRHGDRAERCGLILRRRQLPSQDPDDPGYRRLRYVRYADDLLLGFAGPKHEAEEIKSKIAAFLRDELKLELSGPRR